MPDWDDFPFCLGPVTVIHCGTKHSLGAFQQDAKYSGNAAWPAANLAIYVPFRLAYPLKVFKMFAACEASGAGPPNHDMGIYDSDGTRLVSSGTQSVSGSNLNLQDVTDTVLGPGNYYLALANDNTLTFYLRGTYKDANRNRIIGVLQQASAMVLPATATFAVAGQGYVPLVGLVATENI